jgi:decaprenylphosphoryl-5-phosphoribose phosphatase
LLSHAREADRRLLVLLRTRLRRRGLERAMARYAWAGEYGRAWIVAALGGALLDRRRRGRWLWAALGVPLTLAANFCVKSAVRRERPRLEAVGAAGPLPASLSFPSAHAATSFAGATLIGGLAPPLRPPLYLAAGVMAFSRPYLGVHYPSDVVAGAVVGMVLGRVLARVR